MKLMAGAVLAFCVLAMAFSTKPAEAAGVEKAVTKTALVGHGDSATKLGQPPDVPPTTKPVKPPKPPKPPRSNKNDGDDGSDDGNAGAGNDGQTTTEGAKTEN